MNEEDAVETKRLMEQLRDMIKDGMSDECSICLSEMDHPVITPCAHVYCKPCITQVIENVQRPPAMCPLCRGPLEMKSLLEAARDEDSEETEVEDLDFKDQVIKTKSTKVNAVLEVKIIGFYLYS